MKKEIDIQKFLPHRVPMLFVDELQLLEDGYTTTSFKILANGTFVQNGVLSEIGLIENAAQTCSIIQGSEYFSPTDTENHQQVKGFISSIKSFEVHQLPRVGNVIITTSKLVSKFETDSYSISTLKGQTFVNEQNIADFTINLFITT